MAEVKRASFAIEDMKEGGGNLFGSNGPVRCTLIAGKFSKEAPEGYPALGNPIFAWPVFEYESAGEDGNPTKVQTPQAYSLGAKSGDEFTISEDGDYLIPVSDDSRLVKDSKFGTFAASLQNEGVPKTLMASFQWSKLAGLVGDFKRIADKERTFAEDQQPQGRGAQKDKKKFPATTLVLVKLHAMPGENTNRAASKPAATTTAPATQAAAPAASEGDLDAQAWTYLEQALQKAGGTLQRGQVVLKVSGAAMKEANRQAIARRAGEESFIATLVETGLVTYAASEKGQPVALVTA